MVVNIFLYDGFDILGLSLPAVTFGKLSKNFYLRYLSVDGGLIQSEQGVHVWTEPVNPIEIEDILVVPGGIGAERLIALDEKVFLLLKKMAANADYCISDAEGTALLAQSGVLFHRTVADYKDVQKKRVIFDANIKRVADVDWIADGKFYTCTTILKGLPMIFQIIEECTDLSEVEKLAEQLGVGWTDEIQTIL